MIAALALLSLVCALVLGETRHRAVEDEPADAADGLTPA
jgi:hypothetical protein